MTVANLQAVCSDLISNALHLVAFVTVSRMQSITQSLRKVFQAVAALNNALIRVYDEAGNATETRKQADGFKEPSAPPKSKRMLVLERRS
jgi:hypothetical protein